jgi:hypothetical protein
MERSSNSVPIVDAGAKRDPSCTIPEDIFDGREGKCPIKRRM